MVHLPRLAINNESSMQENIPIPWIQGGATEKVTLFGKKFYHIGAECQPHQPQQILTKKMGCLVENTIGYAFFRISGCISC